MSLFNKYLSTYYVPNNSLDSGDIAANQRENVLCSLAGRKKYVNGFNRKKEGATLDWEVRVGLYEKVIFNLGLEWQQGTSSVKIWGGRLQTVGRKCAKAIQL